LTAACWARSITGATAGLATAHNVDTDLLLLGVHQRTIMSVASRLDCLRWS
jgi:hypothetical protein